MRIEFETRMSTKGWVTLPKAVRDMMNWPPGTTLTVEETEKGVLLKKLQPAFAPTRPEDVRGMLAKPTSKV